MGKGARKIAGFLWALMIAVVSFFVIFIFFPDVSNRFFGVSVRGEDVQRIVKDIGDTVSEKVTESVDKAVSQVSEAVSNAINEKGPEIVDSAVESVSDALKKSGIQTR